MKMGWRTPCSSVLASPGKGVAIGSNPRFTLTSPGREYGWVEHDPFGAPADKPWQGHYLDFSDSKEKRRIVYGATLSEALGLLANEVYPRLQAQLQHDAAETRFAVGLGY